MKESENKKVSLLVESDGQQGEMDVRQDGTSSKADRLKKPIIFVLMGVVFLGCMYLIFKPATGEQTDEDIGLNEAVPQASDAELQADKQKAYEQELLEQKMQEKRSSLLSLSDYWSEDSTAGLQAKQPEEDYGDGYAYGGGLRRNSNPALNSYRNAQHTLTSFYDNSDYETQELRKQIDELKEQLAEKDIPPATTVEDQLALMEKSYEMASRYLPQAPAQPNSTDTGFSANVAVEQGNFVAINPSRKNTVSALYREPTDSAFLANWNRNRGFYTAGTSEQVVQPKNSIKAVVQETQVVTGENAVRLRLLETARTPDRSIPAGTVLTANAKFQGGRLQLKVTSIEFEGNIIPVDITVYDLDGQQGLYVPYSPELDALSEIASNMSQTSGTSIMMTRSAGQQMAGDLSRGVVQGVSGYFSKKVRTPKVTVKSGHQIFLVSKN